MKKQLLRIRFFAFAATALFSWAAVLAAPEAATLAENPSYDRVMEEDTDADGKTDHWAHYSNDKMLLEEIDTDGDGKKDIQKFYNETGRLVRQRTLLTPADETQNSAPGPVLVYPQVYPQPPANSGAGKQQHQPQTPSQQDMQS